VAFSFVESENMESCSWFFRHIKIAIMQDRPNVCIPRDRHTGILKAIKTLQHPTPEEETPWQDL
jgi:hypothetical protein